MNTITSVGLNQVRELVLNRSAYSSNFMESTAEVLSRLKFIGYIEQGEKINSKYVFRQPDTLSTRISRTLLYPDNRNNTLDFIKTVINRSFEILERFIQNNMVVETTGLVKDLLKAQRGITNLKYTYQSDTKFCCNLQVLIETIDTKLNSLQLDERLESNEVDEDEQNDEDE